MTKCSSSSVICFENTTLFIFVLLTGSCIYYFHNNNNNNKRKEENPIPSNAIDDYYKNKYNKKNNDIFKDPYAAPFKHYFPPVNDMNLSSSSSFVQIGFLMKKDVPIALLGRPLQANRDKWQYYCITDQYNSIKIPFIFKGKNSMNEYGCSELSNGDEVTLIGTKDKCKVNLYDNY
jgi:hypothetical protein